MTSYQEQLTQMQHDLEIGLDTMTEVLANSGGDVEGMNMSMILIKRMGKNPFALSKYFEQF